MSPALFVVIVVVLAAVVVAVAVVNRRGRTDGVDSFRRQIDALSPEARRTVVDQVQNAAERHRADDDGAGQDDRGDGADDDPDDHPDEGGARGT